MPSPTLGSGKSYALMNSVGLFLPNFNKCNPNAALPRWPVTYTKSPVYAFVRVIYLLFFTKP